jgi:hypothetical protein
MRVALERGDAVVLVPRLSHGVLRLEGRAPGPARATARGGGGPARAAARGGGGSARATARSVGAGDGGTPAHEPAQGLVAGPVLLSLSREGLLVGAEVLEEQRWWRARPVAWELRTRAHGLRVLEHDPTEAPEPRWDAARRLFWLAWGDAQAPRIVGLGPRAHAAVDGDRLVALLADLRGFGR